MVLLSQVAPADHLVDRGWAEREAAGNRAGAFRVQWVTSRSENEARQIVAATNPDRDLVAFRRSSPAARELLKAAGFCW